jgi:hypothetical protein
MDVSLASLRRTAICYLADQIYSVRLPSLLQEAERGVLLEEGGRGHLCYLSSGLYVNPAP